MSFWHIISLVYISLASFAYWFRFRFSRLVLLWFLDFHPLTFIGAFLFFDYWDRMCGTGQRSGIDWKLRIWCFLSWFLFQKEQFSFILRDSLVCFVFLLSLKVLVGVFIDCSILMVWFSFSLLSKFFLESELFVFFQVFFVFAFIAKLWKSTL